MTNLIKYYLSAVVAVASSLTSLAQTEIPKFIQSSDLSYVNEMLDAGVEYRMHGQVMDPYEIFNEIGNDMVRVRLWHNPSWGGGYSTLDDVIRTCRATKEAGMQVMLNFHYSDNWTDPGKQVIPAAWAEYVDDVDKLGDLMYEYTYDVIRKLDELGLMPEVVQVGNENNNGIMNAEPWSEGFEMDWPRHVKLFNRGIQAVRDASEHSDIQPKIMVHVAQPNNLEYWFKAAFEAGLADIDYMGFSYYTAWCKMSLEEMAQVANRMRHLHKTPTFMVEAAYPWTLLWSDDASNMIGPQALHRGYPATIRGQREFMTDMTQLLIDSGCAGLAYWEPAWVSSDRPTQWGIGSHWENMTFFDFRNDNELHRGGEYMTYPYTYPTPVEFRITAAKSVKKLYLWSTFLSGTDYAVELERDESGEFVYSTSVKAGTLVKYQIFSQSPIVDGELRSGVAEELIDLSVENQKLTVRVDY
jgi:arabinogalactan endo-1,4-beta-galactosidase